MRVKSIDLNADLGEAFGSWVMGDDQQMMTVVSSANIACGGHAGDNDTMRKTINLASQNNVKIGAHPGFEDKVGFGRRRLPLSSPQIENLVAAQVGALAGIASLCGTKVDYVKPHGALGNWAAEDESVARAIVSAVKKSDNERSILAFSGSILEKVSLQQKLRTYSEIFADRGYDKNGNLVPRSEPGAMIDNVDLAIERLLSYFETGYLTAVDGSKIELRADSICIHGDSKNSLAMAQILRQSLENAGLEIKSFID